MRKKIFLLAMLFIATCAQAQEVMTNATVLEMLGKGYSSVIIAGQLENAEACDFSLSLSDLDALKAAGADDILIMKMQDMVSEKKKAEAKTPEYGGVYWWNTGEGPEQLGASPISVEEKSSGLLGAVGGAVLGSRGGALGTVGNVVFGSGISSERMVLSGNTSSIKIATHTPVFRFYIPAGYQGSEWLYQFMTGVKNPREFVCVKLKKKNSKRTFPKGMNISSWGLDVDIPVAGNKDKYVAFDVKTLGEGVFEVTFSEPLEPGEYCFMYKGVKSDVFASKMSAFDFTVE